MLDESKRPIDIAPIPDLSKQPRIAKILNWAILAALLMVATAVFIILKWSFTDENVIEVKNSPFPIRIIQDQPDSNGVVILNIDLCKSADIDGKVRTSFISSSREIFLPESEESLSEGCFTREVAVIIPTELPADTYKVRFRSVYDINPLKKNIVSEFESEEFILESAQ